MIHQLLNAFKQVGLNLNAEEIADILWLALQMQPSRSAQVSQTPVDPTNQQGQSHTPNVPIESKPPAPKFKPHKSTSTPIHQAATDAPLYARTIGASAEAQGLLFKAPSASSLPESLQLAKSLRPFMRRVASHTETVLDEVATAERIAEEGVLVPVLRPAPERWFDLALIIDDSPSMGIWQRTAFELQQLLERHGAFRHVQTWGLLLSEKGQICLRSGVGTVARSRRLHHPKELVDPGSQRLFLVVSDCVSLMWQNGTITNALAPWVKNGPLAIVQMLPEQLWERTALGLSAGVQFRALSPGIANQKLIAEDLASWDTADLEHGLKVPVVTLEPEPLAAWAKMVVGVANASSPGFIIELPDTTALSQLETPQIKQETAALSAKQIVHRYLNTASPTARRLAGLLAAAPVISLPIVRLLQTTMLKQIRQVHIAEVFLGGILKATSPIDAHTAPDYVQYDFVEPEVRSILLDASPLSSSTQVLHEVSSFVAKRAGLSLHQFMAILEDPTLTKTEVTGQQVQPFARVTAQVLRRLGGDYIQMAERMEQRFSQQEVESEIEPPSQQDEIIVTPIGNPFQGHTDSVISVAFSPDGKTIVSGSADKTVRLWNLDGSPIDNPFLGHTDSVGSVAFSPDGKSIVSGSVDKTVRLWNLDGSPIDNPFLGHTDTVGSVAFSPDGKTIVSGSDDNTVRVWSVDGTLLRTLEARPHSVNAVALSADGQTIISGSDDNTVRVWSVDGTLLRTLEGHTSYVNAVALSADGQTIISGSDDNTVRVWSVDGTLLRTLEGHPHSVNAVALSADGQMIISGSDDKTVRLWNLDGQPLCQPLQGHEDEVWGVAFSPDGQRIASGSKDKMLRLWSLQENDKSTSSLYALLIGIDHYLPNRLYKSLKGCVRDINLVTDYFQQGLRMPQENILKLVAPSPEDPNFILSSASQETLPTYKNIVNAFKQITEQAEPNDLVYIHYSGYGGRAITLFGELKGAGQHDEGIVPMDIGEQNGQYLRDVEIATLLKRLTDKGVVVTIVLDSCHSGGATRGDCDIRGLNELDMTNRSPDSLVASRDELISNWKALTDGTSQSSWLLESRDYVLLSACRPNEYAYEYAVNGKDRHGALTYWMIDTLKSSVVGLTYKNLIDRVRAIIQSKFSQQTPMLIGDSDRLFFGTDPESLTSGAGQESLTYAVTVIQVDVVQSQVILGTGAAQGLGKGTRFAIYPLNATDFTDTHSRIAIVEVTEVNASSSNAKILLPDQGGIELKYSIEQGAPAIPIPPSLVLTRRVCLVERETGDEKHQLPLELIDQQKPALDAVRQALADNSWLVEVQEEQESDYQVMLNRQGEYEIYSEAPIQNLTPSLMVDDPDAPQLVVRRLVHLTKYYAVLALDNPTSELNNYVTVEILNEEKSPMFDPTNIILEPGAVGYLRIKNTSSDTDLNITVLDLEPTWEISQIPIQGIAPFYRLEHGQSIDTRVRFSVAEEKGYSQVKETIKLFVTRGSVNFIWLKLPPLDQAIEKKSSAMTRGSNILSEVNKVLDAISTDIDAVPPEVYTVHNPDPSEDWATKQVQITVAQ